MKFLQGICWFLLFLLTAHAQQNDSLSSHKCRNKQLLSVGFITVTYSTSMLLLYQLWYKDYPQSSFHLHNDNNEWLQMDKLGHTYSAYHLGELGYHVARFACINQKQSIWLGGATGLIFLSSVEIFDGFSAGWGASPTDAIANVSGYLLFALQQNTWNEQRFRLKFSYFPSDYAQYRPEILGKTFPQKLLKDYNAQTYWLSFSPASFAKNPNPKWPEWLCFSIGYSGDGMLGGTSNPTSINGNILPHFERNREFLLSMDIDFQKLKTTSKSLKILFYGLNTLKVPFPALYFSTSKNLKMKWLYF